MQYPTYEEALIEEIDNLSLCFDYEETQLINVEVLDTVDRIISRAGSYGISSAEIDKLYQFKVISEEIKAGIKYQELSSGLHIVGNERAKEVILKTLYVAAVWILSGLVGFLVSRVMDTILKSLNGSDGTGSEPTKSTFKLWHYYTTDNLGKYIELNTTKLPDMTLQEAYDYVPKEKYPIIMRINSKLVKLTNINSNLQYCKAVLEIIADLVKDAMGTPEHLVETKQKLVTNPTVTALDKYFGDFFGKYFKTDNIDSVFDHLPKDKKFLIKWSKGTWRYTEDSSVDKLKMFEFTIVDESTTLGIKKSAENFEASIDRYLSEADKIVAKLPQGANTEDYLNQISSMPAKVLGKIVREGIINPISSFVKVGLAGKRTTLKTTKVVSDTMDVIISAMPKSELYEGKYIQVKDVEKLGELAYRYRGILSSSRLKDITYLGQIKASSFDDFAKEVYKHEIAILAKNNETLIVENGLINHRPTKK